MQRRKGLAVGDGQHGQAGALVVVLTVECQCPEVRGRPDEDDQHQQPGFSRYGIGNGGPAQGWGHGTGQTTDHDVLWSQGFEDHGIDHRITNEGGQGQPHGQRIHPVIQHQHAHAAQQTGHGQDLRRGNGAACRTAPSGTQHAGINLAFDQAVDGKGGSRQHPYAQRARDHGARIGQAGSSQKHADNGTENSQLGDSWFSQYQILAQERGGSQSSGVCHTVFLGGQSTCGKAVPTG